MARFTVKRNFSFKDVLKDVAPSESDIREAGERLAVKIENRTLSGLDENGRKFAPYSPAYQRAKKFGKGTVDLHLTSRMFADFGVIESSRRGFKLGFKTEESARKAAAHEAGAGHLPVRKFLGVPRAWIRDLIDRLPRRQ